MEIISFFEEFISGFWVEFASAQVGNYSLAQIAETETGILGGLINFLKIFAYITVPVLLFFFIYLLVKITRLRTGALYPKQSASFPSQKAAAGTFQGRWEEVMSYVSSTREAEWKFAVIEADKLVDESLKNAGYSGDTMGERLMNIDKTKLLSIDAVWEAHKIRNRIAHDINYFLRYTEAKRAVDLYASALRELGLIS